MKYKYDLKDCGYVAPFLGNGNMTFQVDYEGAMQHMPDFKGIRNNSSLRIWQAGRRYLHKAQKDLISYGMFGHRINAELLSAEQELDTENARIVTECRYDGNINARTEIFAHHDFNLISVRKSVNAEYFFDYYLCAVTDKNELPELMTITNTSAGESGIDIEYTVGGGMYPYKGIIRVFAKGAGKPELTGNRVSFRACGESEFYILFCDNVDTDSYAPVSAEIKKAVQDKGFCGIFEAHRAKWAQYNSEGYVKLQDDKINSVYSTAQYHLKCFTTKWSLPVGLNDGSWHGKYFAFDEFYMLMGLLTSNHLGAAKKIPEFRAKTLDYAVERATAKINEPAARYPWETLENGTEGAINGFWHDHVFHMASISGGEYSYYKFSKDRDFLERYAYPVIKACASFYVNHMLYRTENGRLIVGKCTDLERLGSSRENAFMTTCGVIKTLRIFCEVSDILGVDSDKADEYKKLAEELLRCLPNNGERYIPYPGCDKISIGLLSGIYPFDVLEKDNPLQLKGIESYLESEGLAGNMYSVGTGVCSWYMTWKSLVFSRLFRGDEAYEAVKNAAKNSGNFGEMFEINDIETKTIYRPWFTTAAGMLIHSVNEMLLQYDGERILIAPAMPEAAGDFSFRLAAGDGLCVEASVDGGILKTLKVISESRAGESISVSLPPHISTNGTEFISVNNCVTVTISDK
ncbi:MAG: hypothetical protein J6N52_13940 [Clostridia bacterium]|nr:hypothetical protein [Clostridia bacterium]